MLFTPRKIGIAVVTTVTLFLLFSGRAAPGLSFGSFGTFNSESVLRKREIAAAFQHAWDGYATNCLGHDGIHPVSHICDDEFGGWAVAALDALSTAIIMEKTAVVRQILEYVPRIDFHNVTGGGDMIQLFEVSIRHLGGMLSAWDLLQGPYRHLVRDAALLEGLRNQTVALAEVLRCGFRTPSGIPHYWVDPKLCTTDDGTTQTLATAGTLILEFARVSDITGDPTYREIAERSESHLLTPTPDWGEPYPGLLGSYVWVADGKFTHGKGGWGALSDSFYEYLLKAYIYNSTAYPHYLDRWLLAADSTIQHIASHPFGHPDWTLLPEWEGDKVRNTMDSLSWFAGGNLILGGMVTANQTLLNAGLSIAHTAHSIYNMTATGLGPEVVSWDPVCKNGACTANSSVWLVDSKFRLRPEAVETWYYAYRATRDPVYREWAWAAFRAIVRHCKTDVGFSSISNVNAVDGGEMVDVQESFVFAELLKYIYLIHLEDYGNPFHVQDGRSGKRNTWVFNTEAHPLKVVGPPV